MESPVVHLLAETGSTVETLRKHLEKPKVRGPAVHDARIAAICLDHGVTKLLTADRDFGRFSGLRTENPLLGR
jgi:predicted nucleic acid-binding protein